MKEEPAFAEILIYWSDLAKLSLVFCVQHLMHNASSAPSLSYP